MDQVVANMQTSSGARNGPPSRLFLFCLGLTLVAHVAWLAWLLTDLPSRDYPVKLQAGELKRGVGISLAVAGALFLAFARHTHAIAVASFLVVASVLCSPGTVFVVALMMLNAFVVGDRALATIASAESSPRLPAGVVILPGTALWIGLTVAILPFRLHFPATYVLAL